MHQGTETILTNRGGIKETVRGHDRSYIKNYLGASGILGKPKKKRPGLKGQFTKEERGQVFVNS